MYMKEDQNRPELDIIQTDKPGPRKAAVSTDADTHAARNSKPPTAPDTTAPLNDRPATGSDNRPTRGDGSPDNPVPRKKKPATQKRPASDEARKKQGSTKNGTRKNSSSKNKNRASTSGTRKKPGATSHSKKSPVRRKKKNAGRRLHTTHFHIAIIALIILVGVVAAIKLIIWNKGVASDYDPNDTSTEFDTEPEDFLIPPDSQTLALQKDDGITSVLLLGNDALASARGESDNIGVYLEEIIGGKVYNASLSNTYLSVKNAVYDESYQNDVFSLYWITYCMANGDFTLLEDNARSWQGDADVGEVVSMLKDLDMEAIDVITILYDYHDYEDNRLLAGPYDETMAASCCGCLLQSIRLIQQTWPHIRVIVSSPYFVYAEDEHGEPQPASILNQGQGTLADYMVAYKSISVSSHAAFIDNYFGTITEDNYKDYLEKDQKQLNKQGRRAIAERIASFIGG